MTDDEFARQAKELVEAQCCDAICSFMTEQSCGCYETALRILRTTASAARAEGWRAGQEAMRERAAKVCEEDVHNQHPAKPAGVVMSRYPASKPHAYLIRALQPLPPKKEIG